MTNKIKAVIFDIGGVQFFYNHMITAKPIAKLVKRPVKDVFKILSDSGNKSGFTRICEKGASEKEYWEYFAKKLNLEKVDSEKVQKLWDKIFYPNNKILKLLPKLKKTYKLGLISNMGKGHKKYLNLKYGISKPFDTAIFSCDVGISKPNPKIYKKALKKLKVRAYETLFLDDNPRNIKIAKKLGMKTILFKSNKQLFKNKTWKSL